MDSFEFLEISKIEVSRKMQETNSSLCYLCLAPVEFQLKFNCTQVNVF